MTQEQLSDGADMSQNQLARIERGMRRVSLVQLERLAHALGVSLLDLLPVEDPVGGVRLPSGVISTWTKLSASDRHLVTGLLESLANK